MMRLLIMLGCIAGIIACQSNGPGVHTSNKDNIKSEIDTLKSQVIAVHDAVMPKMGDVARITAALDSQLTNATLDTMTVHQIRMAIDNLETSDSLMWDWMHHYSDEMMHFERPGATPGDSLKTFLEGQLPRVSEVKAKTLKAIKEGDALLEKLGHGHSQ